MENFTISFLQCQLLFSKKWYLFLSYGNTYLYKEVSMKNKIILFSFVCWWAVMFPVLNFSEKEMLELNDKNVQFKSLIVEMLH